MDGLVNIGIPERGVVIPPSGAARMRRIIPAQREYTRLRLFKQRDYVPFVLGYPSAAFRSVTLSSNTIFSTCHRCMSL